MITQVAFFLNDYQGVNMAKPRNINTGTNTEASDKLQNAQVDVVNTVSTETGKQERDEIVSYHAAQRRLKRQQRQATHEAIAAREWKELDDILKQLKAEWSRGYNNDWISSVYSIMALSEKLGTALAASQPLLTFVELIDSIPVAACSVLFTGRLPDNTCYVSSIIRDFICDNLTKMPPQVIFSNLAEHAQFTTDNKLNVDSLVDIKSTKGAPMFNLKKNDKKELVLNEHGRPEVEPVFEESYKKLETSLKLVVTAWLDVENYAQDPAAPGKYLHKDTGIVLDKQTFEQLRDDPQHGLKAYLVDKLDYELNEHPAPRPS